MSTMADLRQANASFETQMQEWKQQRFANGENPMDWVAFREHLSRIGAPDPGETPPDEFQRWDESMHGGQPDDQQGSTSGGQVSEVNSLRPDAAGTGDTSTWPPAAGAGSHTSKWPTERPEGRG